jgi:hypothetical protein
MVWKADSTLEASNAEVSMKERPFSAGSHQLRPQIVSAKRPAKGTRSHPLPFHSPRVIPPDSLANAFASSVGTALRCFKSLLLPTSMMTMFWSAWSLSSLSQRVTLSYVACLAMS